MHVETTNEPKKKYYIVAAFLIFCISLTACGPRVYKNRFNIGSSYKKWIKEIGLFSSENINVWEYEEDENLIRLYIMCDNGLDGYKELCDIINAHNKFVEENPDYFPEDMRFNILNVAGSQQIISSFYNLPSGDSELGREGSTKIQCISIDMYAAYYVPYYKGIENDNIISDEYHSRKIQKLLNENKKINIGTRTASWRNQRSRFFRF